jgi:hypothetical protein
VEFCLKFQFDCHWLHETLEFDVQGHVKLELEFKVNMLVISCLFHEDHEVITKDAILE